MHVPSSPIVQGGCVVGGGGGGGGGGNAVGVGAGAGAGAGAAAGASAGADAGAEAVDVDDAEAPLVTPPLLPPGACEEAAPPPPAAVGVAAGLRGARVTDATGSAFPTESRGESLVYPSASVPSAARATPSPPGSRETSLATSP
jgi:hypothetical protein